MEKHLFQNRFLNLISQSNHPHLAGGMLGRVGKSINQMLRNKYYILALVTTILLGCSREHFKSTAGWDNLRESAWGFISVDDRLAVLIWVDSPCGRKGNVSGGPNTYSSTQQLRNGKVIEVQCRIAGDFSGRLEINRKTFDLEEGRLFLVSTKGAEFYIEQHAHNLEHIKLCDDGPNCLMKEDLVISKLVMMFQKKMQ